MSTALVFILVAVVVGIAFARSYGSTVEAKRSNAGWYGIGVLALLFAGLLTSGQADNESAAYGFGIALFVVLSIMLLVGIASAVGRAMRKRKGPAQ